jgi:hypothetical protein
MASATPAAYFDLCNKRRETPMPFKSVISLVAH